MNVKDDWYQKYYDNFLAINTLDTKEMHLIADDEVAFIEDLLMIKKNNKLLDVPCGTGRHSLKLAKKGVNVTGLDISISCIKQAKKGIHESFQNNVTFKKGNMIDLKAYRGKYDHVINMFTSFGYFPTNAQNTKSLKQMTGCLKRNGNFLMSVLNRDWLLNVFKPVDWNEHKDYFLLSRREINQRTNYIYNDWVFINKKNKKITRYPHKLRLYSKGELIELFKIAGLGKIKVFGDFSGGRFHKTETNRIIITGVKL